MNESKRSIPISEGERKVRRKESQRKASAKYRASHPSKNRSEYFKAYDSKRLPVYRARRKEMDAARYLKTKSQQSAKSKAYHAKKRKEIAARKVKWRAENIERETARAKAYRETPKAKADHAAKESRRRAMMAGASLGDQKLIAAWMLTWRKKKRVRCYWCGEMFPGAGCEADHIVALAAGGSHAVDNLCVSCGSCNAKKHAKRLEDWNASLPSPVLL